MVAHRLGPVVGWKVGSATLHSEPFRAPIHEATLRIEDPRLPADLFHVIGVEAEIVYRFARDLPPRATPYARDEVLAAVGSMHPAVEIVDTRFSAFGSVDALSQRADQQNHGALSVGPALVLQLSLVASDSSYLWDDCVEVSHVGRLGKRPCLA